MGEERGANHAHDESSSRGAEPAEQAWFRVTFSTYGAWIRGDARGFRDHDHRIHSSGDYHHPPAESEHAGLRAWVRRNMRQAAVSLGVEQRAVAGGVIVRELDRRGSQVAAVAVLREHVHVLAKLTTLDRKKIVGLVKARASHTLRQEIPGAVWGKRADFRMVGSQEYQRQIFRYIVLHREQGAWVWTYRDPLP